jgi:hypothetical protein
MRKRRGIACSNLPRRPWRSFLDAEQLGFEQGFLERRGGAGVGLDEFTGEVRVAAP